MISIIAAIGKNRELGKDNKLLWSIPKDMERFKKLTMGQVVIMGRKTFQSLPEKFQPLPNRINIIISRDLKYRPTSIKHLIEVKVCHSIVDAVTLATKFNKRIFIIGGASIYQQGIQYADKLYLTLVDKEYPEADAFFPDYSQFKKILSEENYEEKGVFFKFIDLAK